MKTEAVDMGITFTSAQLSMLLSDSPRILDSQLIYFLAVIE